MFKCIPTHFLPVGLMGQTCSEESWTSLRTWVRGSDEEGEAAEAGRTPRAAWKARTDAVYGVKYATFILQHFPLRGQMKDRPVESRLSRLVSDCEAALPTHNQESVHSLCSAPRTVLHKSPALWNRRTWREQGIKKKKSTQHIYTLEKYSHPVNFSTLYFLVGFIWNRPTGSGT